jgi:hypothetical protein
MLRPSSPAPLPGRVWFKVIGQAIAASALSDKTRFMRAEPNGLVVSLQH